MSGLESRDAITISNKIKMIFPEKKPKSASIILTTRCNVGCGMCKIWSLKETEIEFQEAKNIIKDLKSFGMDTINLLGGEPLLYDRIFEIRFQFP